MSKDEFTRYYRKEYGENSLPKLAERLERVEQKGTSSLIDKSVQDLIRSNRAGSNEQEISYDEIVRIYCLT
jgi:hypothetical protein